MAGMMRSSIKLVLTCLLAFSLFACSSSTAGLNSYQSPDGRYAFLYPTGWSRVAVSGGPQVVFHDLINSDETLSMVVSKVGDDVDLEKLGIETSVGESLIKNVIAPNGAGREVELLNTRERKISDHIFYDIEYAVHLQDRDRHELATVVVDHGYLYTLATSTNEIRWPRVEDLFERVITSFTFLI